MGAGTCRIMSPSGLPIGFRDPVMDRADVAVGIDVREGPASAIDTDRPGILEVLAGLHLPAAPFCQLGQFLFSDCSDTSVPLFRCDDGRVVMVHRTPPSSMTRRI